MKLNFSLTGKTALVTGGGGVICSVISHALASQGANVAVCDLSEERATAVAEEIRSEGGRAMGIKVDVLDRTSVEACAAAVQEAWGGIDILINGAGGNKPTATTSGDRSFFDLPEDALTWVFNLNLLGSVLPAQVVGRQDGENRRRLHCQYFIDGGLSAAYKNACLQCGQSGDL